MNYHRDKSEYLFRKSPYYDPGYSGSVTDQQITNYESKAFVSYRRGRIHSSTKSATNKQCDNTENNRQQTSNLSIREIRLKREITKELHNQLPRSIKIWIPIRTTSALPNKKKSTKIDKKQNEQLNKLKNDLKKMTIKMKKQDELIEHLREQLENKETPPPTSQVIQTIVPTMPYVEDPPSIELVQTI